MSRLLIACLTAAMISAAGANPQATGAGSAERANVERIHDRIQAHQKESGRKQGAVQIIIPNTTVFYDMVSIPAGEFAMGAATGQGREEGRAAAAQSAS